jgi:hypothetical protein
MAIRGSMTGRVSMRHVMTACAVALLMVVTACSRGSHHGGSTTSDMDKRRAYAQCMRDNGVSDFPDPNPNGEYGAGHEAISRDDPKFKAANEKCRDLLPAGDKHDVVGPETVQNMVKFAQCMRDNGVPDFPDPGADGKFPRDLEQKAHNDPKFQAASEKCRKDLPQHGGG